MNKTTTILAGILLGAIVIALISLWFYFGVIAYRAIMSGDLALQALGVIIALLLSLTLQIGQTRKPANDTRTYFRPK
jgi:hypothetical protein